MTSPYGRQPPAQGQYSSTYTPGSYGQQPQPVGGYVDQTAPSSYGLGGSVHVQAGFELQPVTPYTLPGGQGAPPPAQNPPSYNEPNSIPPNSAYSRGKDRDQSGWDYVANAGADLTDVSCSPLLACICCCCALCCMAIFIAPILATFLAFYSHTDVCTATLKSDGNFTFALNVTNVIAGQVGTARLYARNCLNNPFKSGGDTYYGMLVSTTNASLTYPVTFVDYNDGTYGAQYTPLKVGRYGLSLYLLTDNSTLGRDPSLPKTMVQIYGSPYFFNVLAGGLDRTQSYVVSVPLTPPVVDTLVTVTVQSRDPFGNVRTTGGDVLSGTIVAPFGVTPPMVTVTDLHNGVYTITFTATIPGVYTVSIVTANQAVVGASININVISGTVDGTLTQVTGATSWPAGKTGMVMLQLKNSQGNLAHGGDVIRAFFNSYEATVVDNGDGTYTATYLILTPAMYTLALMVNGAAVTLVTPFSLTITAAPAPMVTSAAFANTYTSITVVFDQNTNRAGMMDTNCYQLFGMNNTVLGMGAQCVWQSDSTLLLNLAQGTSVVVGSMISFPPSSNLRTALLTSTAGYTNFTVRAANYTAPSMAVLNAPSTVGSCSTLTLDGSGSTAPGASVAPVTFAWNQNSGPTLPAGVLTANAPVIVLDASIPAGRYVFRLRVSNVYGGVSADALVTVNKVAVAAPELTVRGPLAITALRSVDNMLKAVASISPCAPESDRTVAFRWSFNTTASPAMFALDAATVNTPSLYIPAYSMLPGTNYTLMLSAWMASNPTSVNTVQISVGTIMQGLVGYVTGGNNQVNRRGNNHMIMLSAAMSADLDYPAGDASFTSNPIMYSWSCVDHTVAASPVPCSTISGQMVSLPKTVDISLDAFQFAENADLEFIVMVARNMPLRNATGSTRVMVIQSAQSVPQMTITTSNDIAFAKVLTDVALTAVLVQPAYENDVYSQIRTWSWTITSGAIDLTNLGNSSTGPLSSVLVINKEALTPGQTISLRLQATDGGGGVGIATYSFRTQVPPAVGTCFARPPKGYAVETPFTLVCSNFVTPPQLAPLEYKFQVMQGGQSLSLLRKVSSAACTRDVSYGILTNTTFYVSKGCRGDFNFNGQKVSCASWDFAYQECCIPAFPLVDWSQASSVWVLLPAGNLTVVATVRNSIGLMVSTNFQVQVMLHDDATTAPIDDALDKLKDSQDAKDSDGVTQGVSQIGDALNNAPPAQNKTEIRSGLVDVLLNSTTTGPVTDGTIDVVIGALIPVVQVPEEVNGTAQIQVVDHIYDSFCNANNNSAPISPGTIDKTVTVIDAILNASTTAPPSDNGDNAANNTKLVGIIEEIAKNTVGQTSCNSAGADIRGDRVGATSLKICMEDLEQTQLPSDTPTTPDTTPVTVVTPTNNVTTGDVIVVEPVAGQAPGPDTPPPPPPATGIAPVGDDTTPRFTVPTCVVKDSIGNLDQDKQDNLTSVSIVATVIVPPPPSPSQPPVGSDGCNPPLVTPITTLVISVSDQPKGETGDYDEDKLHVDTRITQQDGVVQGQVVFTQYLGVAGTNVSDLTSYAGFPNSPNTTTMLTSFKTPGTSVCKTCGGRLVGYLHPPVSGNYTFYIASTGSSLLTLSTDEKVSNAHPVCFLFSPVSQGQFSVYPSQKSAPIYLVEGSVYFIMALYKNDDSDADFVDVQWSYDGATQATIPGSALSPYDASCPIPPAAVITIDLPVNQDLVDTTQHYSDSLEQNGQTAIPQCGYMLPDGSFSSDGCQMTQTSIGDVKVLISGESWQTDCDYGNPYFQVYLDNVLVGEGEVWWGWPTPDPVTELGSLYFVEYTFPAIFAPLDQTDNAHFVRVVFLDKGQPGLIAGGDRTLWVQSVTLGDVIISANDTNVYYYPQGLDFDGKKAPKGPLPGQNRMEWAGSLNFDVTDVIAHKGDVSSYRCECTHLSAFGVRLVPTVRYSENHPTNTTAAEKPTSFGTHLGLAIGLSIGLFIVVFAVIAYLIYMFQVPHWKGQKDGEPTFFETLWEEDKFQILLAVFVIGAFLLCVCAMGLTALAGRLYRIYSGLNTSGISFQGVFIIPHLFNIALAAGFIVAAGLRHDYLHEKKIWVAGAAFVVDIILFGVLTGVVLIGNVVCKIDVPQVNAQAACKNVSSMLALQLTALVCAWMCAGAYLFAGGLRFCNQGRKAAKSVGASS